MTTKEPEGRACRCASKSAAAVVDPKGSKTAVPIKSWATPSNEATLKPLPVHDSSARPGNGAPLANPACSETLLPSANPADSASNKSAPLQNPGSSVGKGDGRGAGSIDGKDDGAGE